jgi:CheY-like chemotaxis protein
MHEAIMIVEKDSGTVELARRVLRNERYDVCVARDGEQALQFFRSFRPRLVLSDMRLPGRIEALEMVRQIRAESAARSTAIVMVTTDASEAEAQAAIAAGCDAFISQPLSTLMLRRLVADWTAKEPTTGRLSPTGRTWMSRLFEPARRRRTVVQIPGYRAGSSLPPAQGLMSSTRLPSENSSSV